MTRGSVRADGLALGEVRRHDAGDRGVDLEVVLDLGEAPAVRRLLHAGVQHLVGELGVAAVPAAALLEHVQEHHRRGAHLGVVLTELLDRQAPLVLQAEHRPGEVVRVAGDAGDVEVLAELDDLGLDRVVVDVAERLVLAPDPGEPVVPALGVDLVEDERRGVARPRGVEADDRRQVGVDQRPGGAGVPELRRIGAVGALGREAVEVVPLELRERHRVVGVEQVRVRDPRLRVGGAPHGRVVAVVVVAGADPVDVGARILARRS